MGNRAVITTNKNLNETGIYLHWNGGRASVEAFLAYCNLKGYRPPCYDCYGWSYLCGVVTNFFGSGLSVGVDNCQRLDTDNYDNGVYLLGDTPETGWYITGRMFYGDYPEQYDYDLWDTLKEIDERMPEHMRLTAGQWERFAEVKEKVMEYREKNGMKDKKKGQKRDRHGRFMKA